VKWLRRIVLLAPALSSLVIAWQCYPDPFFTPAAIAGAGLWTWDAWQRIKEVESE
jgi:hypothetical protein